MMRYGIALENYEITDKQERIYNRFKQDQRESIPSVELRDAIVQEFDIPEDVVEAYMTIAINYYATDWRTVLDNVIKLMRTKVPHSVYEHLRVLGLNETVANAKRSINMEKRHEEKMRRLIHNNNNTGV